jgi:hypothetical protein
MSPLSAIERLSLLLMMDRSAAAALWDQTSDRPSLPGFVLEPSIT